MRTVVVHAALSTVITTFITFGAAPAEARQSHEHPPAQTAKPKPATPKPGGEDTQKPNRPKPENQPGAVADAEKLAASHADHHEMKKLEGGGVLPPGWQHRFDLPNMKLEDVRVLKDGDDVHVTSGPPGIYYDPAVTASGAYVVSATFKQIGKGEHREGYGPFVGGASLDGKDQRYLYFLVRQDGRFLIKERVGVNTRGITDWTEHSAIKSFGADGSMSNELSIAADAATVRFLINGVEVAQQPRAQLATDGIVGLRVNHQLDVLVENLKIAPSAAK